MIIFNADKNKLSIDFFVSTKMRAGRSRSMVFHVYEDGDTKTFCNRMRVDKLKEHTNRAGTNYLTMCAYCVTELQRPNSRVERLKTATLHREG